MSQRLDLFKKYLFPKATQIIGKSNEEESKAIRRTPPRLLIPPNLVGASRPPSFLERELFPVVKRDLELPTSSDDKSSVAQLTIFYAGTINVYDNVTVDKAQAIMLLAGKNSLSAPVVESTPKIDVTKLVQPSNLPSICKLQADLPIARKHSLQRFLEKRRYRKADSSPYIPSTIAQPKNDEPSTSDDLNDQRSFSPLPFPSRGHFFPIAANKGY
ncbi:unnamed protein product [Ilex paraguariensis]|uniref:Protein TIFY n=1 Tax=Ilex paraguariensis TaxID=185542 RepID=A0ABC8SDM4_9AQUA